MAALEKLARLLEAVKLSQNGGNSGGSSLPDPTITEHPRSMASSIASSISQQGQGLLSKKEQILTNKEKSSTCSTMADTLILAKPNEVQKLLGVGFETLLLLSADNNPDVRTSANEALNRVIRGLSESQMGKIQVELYKEIKKNGSVRSLRAALTRFAALAHHIRPQKGRAYVQNLLPYIMRMSQRSEELLLDNLASSLDQIMSALGNFTNDNEVKGLLKAFLLNMGHDQSSIRRSAVSSLITLCKHSRKPQFFFGYLLAAILQLLIPIRDQIPSNRVLGCLLCLKALLPYIAGLCAPVIPSDTLTQYQASQLHPQECTVSYDQIMQIYELCLHYSSNPDHNIITASLETLQTLLQNPPVALILTLTNPEGIHRSRIFGDPQGILLSSRVSSQLSIAPSLAEEDLALDLDSTNPCVSVDVDTPDASIHIDATTHDQTRDLKPRRQSSEDLLESYDVEGDTLDGGGCVDDDDDDDVNAIYSTIEIGQLDDTGVLFNRGEIDLSSEKQSSSRTRRKPSPRVASLTHTKSLEDRLGSFDKVKGSIGSFQDNELPVRYLVRYLSSSFLLSGHTGSLISDRTVRVSIKVLALNCVGLAVMIYPSLLAQPLFISAVGDEVELVQHVDDILRFHSHSDPQIGASVGMVIGQFIKASLVHNCGQYSDLGRPSLALSSLLHILCKLVCNESTVTVRGAVGGVRVCICELLHSVHAAAVLPILPHIVNTAAHSYWLVKVELCELIWELPLSYIDHLEVSAKLCPMRLSERFSHRIVTAIIVPLLSDADHRVRTAAATAAVKLVSELMSSGDLIEKVAHDMIQAGHLRVQCSEPQSMYSSNTHQCTNINLPSTPVPPFHCLFNDRYGNKDACFSTDGQDSRITDSLSRLILTLTNHLMTTSDKYLMVGCIEGLSLLSDRYPPSLYPDAWNCTINHVKASEGSSHMGLITQVLSMCGESSVAGDLNVQQYIITLAANILAGFAVEVLRNPKEENVSSKIPWSFLGSPTMMCVGDSVVQHLLRVLSIYTHVLDEIVPGSRPSLPPMPNQPTISPIKRKSRADSTGEKAGQHSSSSNEKTDGEEKEKKSVKGGPIGTFAHLPEYIKLYDVLKNANANYKMSLESGPKEKLCSLLRVSLIALGRLLEISSINEFGKLAEELLQYLKSVTSLLPSLTVQCGQQLLKCLFGSNIMAVFDQLSRKTPDALPSRATPASNLPGTGLHHLTFSLPLNQLESDLNSISVASQDSDSIGFNISQRKSSIFKLLTRSNDKSSLSSYIRLFEQLVIKALKLYTVSSDVVMQRSVLQLLIHLVQIRVNYCLLDSDQIFIGYVIKQFEFIEEGQIKDAEELIPSMFRFLVLLSYERHHSKKLLGVPKIIQLCDGLMASGQPPLSHCVLALQPLVEDLFLVRSASNNADQKELDTQREVLCSMLLRLACYHQVLRLISLVLGATRETNTDRWRKLSRQVIDTLLPLISKLQVNLDSQSALSAVEEVMSSVCASVFRPVDCILKAVFTSPCELETTVGVERWVGGVLVLVRILITHSACDLVLARLEELGLSMDYVHTDTHPDRHTDTPPIPTHSQTKDIDPKQTHEPNPTMFKDPLNVTQPNTLPQVAMARFLLEVVRVSVGEIRSVRLAQLNLFQASENISTLDTHTPGLLVDLSHHLLLTLLHLTQSGQWAEVISSVKQICTNEVELIEEITEGLLFVCGWYPSVTLIWCKLLTCLDIMSHNLWTRVLRTSHRKSPSVSSPVASEASGPSSCLSLEYMRQCALIVFSQFVVRHMQEDEWLTWLVVQHISDIVQLHHETPVQTLLTSIHSSHAASSLLIQAIHARCEYVDKAEYGEQILSVISNLNVSQSGSLVLFIVEKLLPSPYLVITRTACNLATQRLNLLMSMVPVEVIKQLPKEDLAKIVTHMRESKMDKRYGHLFGLIQQLMYQVYGGDDSDTSIDTTTTTTTTTATTLDLNWYLQLVRSRCMKGEGGGMECSQLLSHLEYSEIISIMSSKSFNSALLIHTFRQGLTNTLQRGGSLCGGSIDEDDDSSSGSGGSVESPLYTASRVILHQHLSQLLSNLPRPHHTFMPGGGNKYSERVCKVFGGGGSSGDDYDDDGVGKMVETFAPVVMEYLNTFNKIPSGVTIQSHNAEHILRFALLAMEYLHWQVWLGCVSVEVGTLCLGCVDSVLKSATLSSLLSLPERSSYVCSIVASLHASTSYFIKPRALPSLPPSLNQFLTGSESSVLMGCKRLMQLVLWLETEGHTFLPSCLVQPIRGIVMGVGRMSVVNNIVRLPPDLWTLGWTPQCTTPTTTTTLPPLPPLPPQLLQETDVLKQFVFRMELFGWIGRQQFEETWMALLSVLNSTPSENTAAEELPFINLSLCLAVRGITALLVQTLLLPTPGNPHSSHLLTVPRDKPPPYLPSKSGRKLQSIMTRLHDKLREVQHLVKGVGSGSSRYQLGQVSVEYLVTALASHSEPPDSPDTIPHTGCYEYEMRESQLSNMGLDVQSCIHFLHYLYSSWLRPQSGLCSCVIGEVVKSVVCLCDLFCSYTHHRWVLESLVPLHTSHPIEDYITHQYLILASCKALATLRLAKQEVSSTLSEGVVHMVESGLKNGAVSVRTCAIQGLLYLLQGPPEDSPPLIILAANYILKYNDGKSRECEMHEIAVWEVWVYLVEHYESLPDPTLPSTALHMALSTAATTSTTPKLLRQVLRGLERLVLVQQLSSNTVEVVFKLVMDLVLNGTPSTSLAALPLLITALYVNVRNVTASFSTSLRNPSSSFATTYDIASDPETLLLVLEKLSIFFDRIRVGYPHEAGVIAGLLGPCLLDVLPASQILNKVITEYISSHQPHPHLLASTLFQVFEGAMSEGGEGLVQEWVLLSLSNFTQRSPISLAVWCLTCFFIAASSNRWLRAAFPSVQARLGKLESRDIEIFCLSASHFRQSLATEEQRAKFEAVFQAVATPGSPFQQLLDYIDDCGCD